MKHTVSIIMPAFNAEKFFPRSIGSVLRQTYTDWQVIIVNDGSLDGTLAAATAYAKNDKRFKVVTIPHGGVSRARNEGLKYADGEYLQFMDADDELDDRFLEKMCALLEDNGADLSICRFEHPFFKTFTQNRVYDLSDTDDLLALYQDCYAVVMPWNRIWRRRCFTEKFDEDVHFSEDELGNLANLPNVKRVATTDEYLYNYFLANKQNSEKEESCVNNIINSVAFWDNQTSFYYMGASLLPKRRAIIEKAIRDKRFNLESADELCYYRLVDYCFWQMPAYIGMGIPCEGLAKECMHIFDDERFIRGISVQQKYGFRLLKLTAQSKAERAERFTRLCYKAYAEHGAEADFKIAYTFIMIYLKLFTETYGELNTVNFQARFIRDMQNGATKEARYVNTLVGQ